MTSCLLPDEKALKKDLLLKEKISKKSALRGDYLLLEEQIFSCKNDPHLRQETKIKMADELSLIVYIFTITAISLQQYTVSLTSLYRQFPCYVCKGRHI